MPFTFFVATCNGPVEIRFAYNQKEAAKNISEELHLTEAATAPEDTMQYQSTIAGDSFTAGPIEIPKDQNLTKENTSISDDYSTQIFRKIMMPAENSLSGIGAVFYFRNLTGKIAVAISLLISLIMLIAFRFLKSPIAKRYLLFASILCTILFISDSFMTDVTLKSGAWCLLLLLLIQLVLEYKEKKKTQAGNIML